MNRKGEKPQLLRRQYKHHSGNRNSCDPFGHHRCRGASGLDIPSPSMGWSRKRRLGKPAGSSSPGRSDDSQYQGGEIVRTFAHLKHPVGASVLAMICMGFLLPGMTSCKSPHEVTRRAETNLDPGWPRGNNLFHQVSYQAVGAKLPTVEGAECLRRGGRQLHADGSAQDQRPAHGRHPGLCLLDGRQHGQPGNQHEPLVQQHGPAGSSSTSRGRLPTASRSVRTIAGRPRWTPTSATSIRTPTSRSWACKSPTA